MKYFIAITLIAAVASAAVVRPLRSEIAEIQEIIAAIQSPSTNPATAAALEEMLLDILGVKPEPVQVGPAIINPVDGISVGPAIIPFPLPDGALAEEPVLAPSPVSVVEGPAPSAAAGSPLVQVIVNVNQAAAESSPVSVGPAIVPEPVEIKPDPVHVVEDAAVIPVHPIGIVAPEESPINPIAVHPIGIVAPEESPITNPIAVNPIGVVAPQPAEPIQVGVPILPKN